MDQHINRTSAFAVAVFICTILATIFGWSSRVKCNDSTCIVIDGKVNPNNAPFASLVRLPNIGISKAGAIVEYRDNFSKTSGDRKVFKNPEQLQEVKGIGPKTVDSISQWLSFE